MKLHVGDKVRIIAGKDKGREGVIEKVYKKQNKVLVSEINMYKRHMRKSEQLPQGGIIDIARPIDASKVMKLAADGKTPTRVGYVIENGKKFRVEKKSGERLANKKK